MNSFISLGWKKLSIDKRAILILTFVIQATVVTFAAFTGKITTVFLGLSAAIILAVTLFSVRATLFLLVGYIALLPLYPEQNVSKVMSFQFSIPIATAILLLLICYWLIDRSVDRKMAINVSRLDKAVFAFLVVIVLSALIGFAHGYQNFHLFREVFFLSLYVLYFIVAIGVDEEWIYWFFNFFVVISVLVSFEFLLIAMPHYQSVSYLPFRLVTQQPRLALVTIPFLLAVILSYRSRRIKLLAIFPIVCLLAMVLISLTRGVWVGLIASLFALFLVHTFAKGTSPRAFFRFAFLIILIPLFLFSTFLIIQKFVGGSSMLSIVLRIFTLKNPFADPAMAGRIVDYQSALSRMGGNILWGRGLGDTTSNFALKHSHNIIDNSYLYLYWKTGILGVGTFLIMFLVLFQRCFYVLQNSLNNVRRRIIALTAISCFVGLGVSALADTAFTSYNYIAIWAIVMGSVELIAKKIASEKAFLGSNS